MRNRAPSRVRPGTEKRYYAALSDLRQNPDTYTSTEWCNRHGIGHSVPRAMFKLGLAHKINGKVRMTRERVTSNMIQEIIEKKRQFDNLRHEKHCNGGKPTVTLFEPKVEAVKEQSAKEQPCEVVQHQRSVGLIRRFINWIY